MVYFVTFTIIIAVCLLLLLAINMIYGLAFSYLIRGGLKEDYLMPRKNVFRYSVFTIAVLCAFAIGIAPDVDRKFLRRNVGKGGFRHVCPSKRF